MPKFFVVRVNRDSKDTHAASSLERALELAGGDRGDRLDFAEVTARDAGEARLIQPAKWHHIANPSDLMSNPRSRSPRSRKRIVDSDGGVHDYKTRSNDDDDAQIFVGFDADNHCYSGRVELPDDEVYDWIEIPVPANELMDVETPESYERAAAAVYAAAMRKKYAASPAKGREARFASRSSGRSSNPSSDDSDTGVVARTLFVVAWSQWAEENGELPRQSNLFDAAPDTPDAAELCAQGLVERVELLNDATWGELYARAKAAPGKHYRKATPEDFAYGITMQMMGEGVSWFDDHPQFPIKLPRVSVDYDGEGFNCQTTGGRNPARARAGRA